MYLLIDANLAAGYYLPRSLSSKRARGRIQIILDSIRTKGSQHFPYISNFCIAEVFSVFAKHSWGTWNNQLKNKGTIDTRVYRRLVAQFQSDIHNGSVLYQYELSRYHILGIDLVAPIDHYYQITRTKPTKAGKKPNKQHRPAGTFDHLLLSMGIQLAHLHGAANTIIVTADRRLALLLAKCRSGIPAATVKKLQLDRAMTLPGHPFAPSIFPQCLDLTRATKSDLIRLLGEWPLPVPQKPVRYRWERH
jgi:hypothetical protein